MHERQVQAMENLATMVESRTQGGTMNKTTDKLWGGRFSGEADTGFARFNESFSFDRRLFEVDVRASIAHCDALVGAAALTVAEADQIKAALKTIAEKRSDEAKYFDGFPSEDVHSFVEARLTEMIGDLGRKLHAGRSRNDQVATDLRLWTREEIDELQILISEAQRALIDLAETNREIVIPGYTHLQRGQ